jgi:osmoprotectant transport system permease protein
VSVGIGLALALPLGVLAFRLARRCGPRARRGDGAATRSRRWPMFSLLPAVTGLSATTVVVGLVLYSLTILVRNVLAGCSRCRARSSSRPPGCGYSPLSLLLRVQLPLALPALFAGIRVATVSTVALATVGAILGNGGSATSSTPAWRTQFQAEVLTATVLVVALAVLADVLLLGAQRAGDPLAAEWRVERGRRRRRVVRRPGALVRPERRPDAVVEHLGLTAAALGIACAIAVPLALWLGPPGPRRPARGQPRQRRPRRPDLRRARAARHRPARLRARGDDHRAGAVRDPADPHQRLRRDARGRPRRRRGGRGASG